MREHLKTPVTGEIIAKNVTPKEAFSALLKWGKAQSKAPKDGLCK